MAALGSFALLLALALSVYTFLAGIIALVFQNPAPAPGRLTPGRATPVADRTSFAALLRQGSERIGETARRAGIATFGAVFLASLILVICAFQDRFDIAYIFHHSNRDLPGPYKFAVLWSGQEGSLLFWSLLLAAYGFVLRLRYKTDPRLFAYASVVLAGVQIFFLLLLNLAANPFGVLEGALRPDGSGLNPLLQYPEMVIHPPMLYLGYVGFTVPVRLRPGRAHHEVSRREVDSHHPPLDHGHLGLPHLRSLSRRALGLLRAGLGRLLGMGPRRKCLAHALAHRHRFSALGHDAGKARHAEDVEHVAGLRHVLARHPRNVPHPKRHHQLRARLRAIFHRRLVRAGSSCSR